LGYNYGKKVKGKRQKRKTKNVASDVAVFLLIQPEQFTLYRGDTMGIELLASPSIGATRCGHALTYVFLYHQGWTMCAPEFV
jgi:hypothetical protein